MKKKSTPMVPARLALGAPRRPPPASRRPTSSALRASSSTPPPPPPTPSIIDPAFLVKLALVSTTGAALVKYGSLYLDAPFHPTAAAAAGAVSLPTLAYGALLAVEAARTVKGPE